MAKRVRILFYAPDQPEAAGNVWADLDPAAGTLTLLHDYGADLAPVAGWEVEAGNVGRWEVRHADGRKLTVVRIGGA